MMDKKHRKGLECAETRNPIIKAVLPHADRICAELKKLNARGLFTFEFLVSQKNGKIYVYFSECNARTQVEHKVTEKTLGGRINLIEWSTREVLGRSYNPVLESVFGKNFEEGIRKNLFNQPKVMQFRILGCEVLPALSDEPNIMYSGITGRVTKLRMPKNNDDSEIILGIQEGTLIDLSKNIEPQIGIGLVKGNDWHSVYRNAILLAQSIEIEIDHKPTRLNLDFVIYTLEKLLTLKTTKTTDTWPQIEKEYAVYLKDNQSSSENAEHESPRLTM